MQNNAWFIIDFDSTFTQVEAMEELAAISLKNDPEKEDIIAQIKHLTNLAMEGKMDFGKSLKARIALLSAKKYHINMLVNKLRKKISPSFARNREFFKSCQGRVLIVSGGFKEFIVPVVKPYFIDESCVFANTFTYDKKNNITGADEQNPLASENGKVTLMKSLNLKGKIYAIGDGYTDYQMRQHKTVHHFFAFTENVSRQAVTSRADVVAPSLDEILYRLKLPMALSYPKSRIKVMLAGEDTFVAEELFNAEGYQTEKITTADWNSGSPAISDCSLLVVSDTIKAMNLQPASKLMATAVWGRFSNQFDLARLQSSGIPVFTAPFANARMLAELGLGFILSLSKNNFSAGTLHELKGRTLGIAGYGNAGSLLGMLAEGLGMQVCFYDYKDRIALGNATTCRSYEELLRKSDYLVLFGDSQNELKLGKKELKLLNRQACAISLGMDHAVELDAVKRALSQQELRGFAMDCLDKSSYKSAGKWQGCIVTYNLRNQSEETRENTARFICEKLVQFVNSGTISAAVNFPEIHLHSQSDSHRFIHIHKNKPGILARINDVFARNRINISGQYLKTYETIGCAITDVAKKYDPNVIEELKAIDGTIRFRVLY